MHLIITGHDGSPQARVAAAWAADEAVQRNAQLIVVTALHVSLTAQVGVGRDDMLSARGLIARDRARGELDVLRKQFQAAHPNLSVSASVIDGQPAAVLTDQAAQADLLVVGTKGLGDERNRPRAAVARALVHTSPCPLVLVPADLRPARDVDPHVVVAVDGTSKSSAALDWAVDEARRRSAALTVLHVWHRPTTDGWSAAGHQAHVRASQVLEQATLQACQRDGVNVRETMVEGPAAEGILTVAADAELIVVGSRVDRGLNVSTVGSVAEAVVAHSHRPIAVVTGQVVTGR